MPNRHYTRCTPCGRIFLPDARLQFADQEAASYHPERAEKERQAIEARLATMSAMSGVILQHNQKCRPADAVVYAAFNGLFDAALFKNICDLRRARSDLQHSQEQRAGRKARGATQASRAASTTLSSRTCARKFINPSSKASASSTSSTRSW